MCVCVFFAYFKSSDMSFVEVDGNADDIASPEDVANGNYELQVYLLSASRHFSYSPQHDLSQQNSNTHETSFLNTVQNKL